MTDAGIVDRRAQRGGLRRLFMTRPPGGRSWRPRSPRCGRSSATLPSHAEIGVGTGRFAGLLGVRFRTRSSRDALMFARRREARPGHNADRRADRFRQPALRGGLMAFTLCFVTDPAIYSGNAASARRRRRPCYQVLASQDTVGRAWRSARGPRTASYRRPLYRGRTPNNCSQTRLGHRPAAALCTSRRVSPGTTSKPPMTVSKPAPNSLYRRSTKRTSLDDHHSSPE